MPKVCRSNGCTRLDPAENTLVQVHTKRATQIIHAVTAVLSMSGLTTEKILYLPDSGLARDKRSWRRKNCTMQVMSLTQQTSCRVLIFTYLYYITIIVIIITIIIIFVIVIIIYYNNIYIYTYTVPFFWGVDR